MKRNENEREKGERGQKRMCRNEKYEKSDKDTVGKFGREKGRKRERVGERKREDMITRKVGVDERTNGLEIERKQYGREGDREREREREREHYGTRKRTGGTERRGEITEENNLYKKKTREGGKQRE
jgi:hypothetical protein